MKGMVLLLGLGGCSTGDWCTRFNLQCQPPPADVEPAPDADGDLWRTDEDCDDDNPAVHPSAVETWYDGIDQDCDGASDWDADGDGFDADWHPDGTGSDCDDSNPDVHPDATERWYDGTDDDCDGNFSDADGDGQDAAEVGGPDCDDSDPTVYLDAPETWYDGIDQDCYPWTEYDADVDGFDSADHGGTDCDDASRFVNPGQPERCDGRDADCNGVVDDQDTCEAGVRFRTIVAIDGLRRELWRTPAIAPGMDADGDGEPELILAHERSDDGHVWAIPLGDGVETYPREAVARIGSDGDDQYLGYSPISGTDLDADGHADLVVGGLNPIPDESDYPGVVWTFFGPLSGIVLSGEADATRIGTTPQATLGRVIHDVGDLDGDGMPDLLALQERDVPLPMTSSDMAFLLLPGATTGTMPVGEDVRTTVSVDLDASGGEDISPSQVDGVTTADLDGDGNADLVLGLPRLSGNGGAAVFLGPLDPGFPSPDALAPSPAAFGSDAGWAVVVPGDLDGDGTPDVAIGVPTDSATPASTVIFVSGDDLLAGNLTLPLAVLRSTFSERLGQKLTPVGDLDGDAIPDMVASAGSAPLRLLSGATQGVVELQEQDALIPDQFAGLGAPDRARAAGDVDGDGVIELLVALSPDGATAVLLDIDPSVRR